jgi:hypothetical protein
MALPRLNDTPKYDLVIPSLQETVRYRPFLVKEQKVLMLAYEAQDKKHILKAILDTIDACVDGSIEVNKLATYDIDYIFTQIRSKSVGETAEIQILCSECEQANEVNVNLGEIEIDAKVSSNNLVKINDTISVKLRHPSYSYFMDNDEFFGEGRSQTDMMLDLIISCLDSVMTEDEVIKISDEPIEEVRNFIDSLTTDQFGMITKFVEDMPAMKQDIKFKCNACGEENNRTLKGLDDFF